MKAIDHVVVLEPALACLIANGAVDRMIDEQELQYSAHRFFDSLVVGANDHSFRRESGASRSELWHLFDFDEAHPAIAVDWKIRVVAVMRDVDSDLAGSLDQVQAVRHL
jgi:hypothetical protein